MPRVHQQPQATDIIAPYVSSIVEMAMLGTPRAQVERRARHLLEEFSKDLRENRMTPAKRQRIVAVMSDPNRRWGAVRALARELHVARETIYRIMREERGNVA